MISKENLKIILPIFLGITFLGLFYISILYSLFIILFYSVHMQKLLISICIFLFLLLGVIYIIDSLEIIITKEDF